jgi:hypothetical protein
MELPAHPERSEGCVFRKWPEKKQIARPVQKANGVGNFYFARIKRLVPQGGTGHYKGEPKRLA